MRTNIQIAVLALLVVLLLAQSKPTRLIYFIEHEDEQEEDYIEVTL